MDGDGDGQTDEFDERRLMGSFMYHHNSSNPVNGNPRLPIHFYNFQNGSFKNGASAEFGGDGISGTTGDSTRFMFSFDTDPKNSDLSWSEGEAGNIASDRRFVISTYPFTLAAGDTAWFEFAVVFSHDDTQIDQMPVHLSYIRAIKNWYYNEQYPNCFYTAGVAAIKEDHLLSIYPIPGNDKIHIGPESEIKQVDGYDLQGNLLISKKSVDSHKTELSVTTFSQGVYLVVIRTESGIFQRKIMKE